MSYWMIAAPLAVLLVLAVAVAIWLAYDRHLLQVEVYRHARELGHADDRIAAYHRHFGPLPGEEHL